VQSAVRRRPGIDVHRGTDESANLAPSTLDTLERRDLDLKGKAEPVGVLVLGSETRLG
jgi:hypothetical protein